MDRPPAPRRAVRWYWWALAVVVGLVLAVALRPAPPPIPEPSEAELRALVARPQVIASGEALYRKNCTLCHGLRGEGTQGPNLRDDWWIKGSDMTDLTRSIAEGNSARGMAAWKNYLQPDEIHALAAFIASLHGTEDGTGRLAEGRKSPIAYAPVAIGTATPFPAPAPVPGPPPAPAR